MNDKELEQEASRLGDELLLPYHVNTLLTDKIIWLAKRYAASQVERIKNNYYPTNDEEKEIIEHFEQQKQQILTELNER